AEARPDEPARSLAELSLPARPVINLSHVTRGAGQIDNDRVTAHHALDGPFQVIDVVGRDPGAKRRGMAGIVHQTAQQLTAGIPGSEHANLRVDRSGWLDDLRVAFSGMRVDPAVGHPEAPVERDLVLVAAAGREDCLLALAVRLAERGDGLPDHPLAVERIRAD